MYEKIKKTDFDPVEHFNSKMENTTIESTFRTIYVSKTEVPTEIIEKKRKIKKS